MTVNDSGGLGLFDDLKVGNGVLDTVLDAVKVDGFEAVYAVGLDAALVALKKNVSTDLRILAGNAVAYKAVNDKICNCFPIDNVSCHDFIPSSKKFFDLRSRHIARPPYNAIISHFYFACKMKMQNKN